MKILSKIYVGLSVLLFGSGAEAHQIGPFTFLETNVEALNESMLMTTSMLVSQFGNHRTAIQYSGTFTESAWEAHMTGTYAGTPLNFSFTGTFDGSSLHGNFTSSGTHGEDTWSGSGTWSFTPESADSIRMFFDSQAKITNRISHNILVLDKHFTVPKRWTKSMLDGFFSITDFGVYRSTLFGIPIPFTKQTQISDWIERKSGRAEAFATYSLPDDTIALVGNIDFAKLTDSGRITVAFESTTINIVAIGKNIVSRVALGSGQCNPGNKVFVSVGISPAPGAKNSAGNMVTGTARCGGAAVAGPLTVTDLGADVKEGVQVKGAATCDDPTKTYKKIAPDDSLMDVTCTFH